jgi:hypothetical protein
LKQVALVLEPFREVQRWWKGHIVGRQTMRVERKEEARNCESPTTIPPRRADSTRQTRTSPCPGPPLMPSLQIDRACGLHINSRDETRET